MPTGVRNQSRSISEADKREFLSLVSKYGATAIPLGVHGGHCFAGMGIRTIWHERRDLIGAMLLIEGRIKFGKATPGANSYDLLVVPKMTRPPTTPNRPALTVWPRGMSLGVAAQYCGVGTGTLTTHGPKPVKIGLKRLVWLREDLDAWLDRLAGKPPASGEESNPWDAYGEDHAAVPADL